MIPTYFGPQDPANRAVGDFVSSGVFGAPGQLEKYCTMAVTHGGKLVAGTVYHNWHPDDGVIELTSYSDNPRWLTRKVVQAMFALPFDMLGARLVVLRVSEHNAKMRGIARRFGFHETIIPRLRGDNEAECVYTLSAHDWSNHRMSKHGQERSEGT